jgi:hypothetical protein
MQANADSRTGPDSVSGIRGTLTVEAASPPWAARVAPLPGSVGPFIIETMGVDADTAGYRRSGVVP